MGANRLGDRHDTPAAERAVSIELQYECLDRPRDVLQRERPQLLEIEIEPIMHMIAHGSRDTYAARRAFGLQSDRHIDRVTMQVGSVRDRIADVDPDPKADSPIRWLVTVMDGNILLHLDCAAHCPIDAVEYHEQGVAAGLNNSAAMPLDGGIDEIAAEPAQPFEGFQVIQPDQAAVADHVGIDDGDQSPRVRQPTRSCPMPWSPTWWTTYKQCGRQIRHPDAS